MCFCICSFFFQAEDGIRDLVRSRGLGDVYKRQNLAKALTLGSSDGQPIWLSKAAELSSICYIIPARMDDDICLLYTSDAADERSSVDLGGRRIIKKKKKIDHRR